MTLAAERTSGPTEAPAAAAHPLSPLRADEIAAASALLDGSGLLPDGTRYVFIELAEPPKSVVRSWSPGSTWDRQAAVLLRNPRQKSTYEAIVSLTAGVVVSCRLVEGVQPPMMAEEFMACEEVVRNDPQWQAAMRLRGVEDFSRAMIDPWASGYTGTSDLPSSRRLARPLTFVRADGHSEENGYARPVEGLIVTVDLDSMTVVDVIDHGVVPLPSQPGNYYPELLTNEGNIPAFSEVRQGLRAIDITQPDGPSYDVDGHAISWANWRLRIGFTPREGLVLHDVGYVDKGVLRPVLYRASLAEMYVPYGDPAPTHWNKNVFDEGEYGLGWLANSLELGCDCLGEIRYFDAMVNDQDGAPVRLANAVCMHEEDASIGWKHTDFRTGRGEVRRNRRLVLSFIATVGNYEYGFYWHLYLDGSIEFEIKLTGVLSTGAISPGQTPEFGTLIAPGLYAPHHEHYFSVRMHMQVDSDRNNLFQVDSEREPLGPTNPHGNAWRVRRTHLTTEAEAQCVPNQNSGRTWLIASADTTSALGTAPAYQLEPGSWTPPLWHEDSQQGSRGGFATKQLWATPFQSGERYAAGEYVAQNPGPDGLVRYTEGNRSLEAADLVLWYTLGAHHIARPEDWPVMPVAKVGFHLKPAGFFDGNPMLDLPAEQSSCHTGSACHDGTVSS